MTGKTVVEIVQDQLGLGPATVSFQRTLRIPETGVHPLPPGLGEFPLRRVSDYPDTAPPEWLSRGGVMLPIYQREAMWLSFDAPEPAALQIGVGKVCAVSGLPWIDHLIGDPQNYVALPEQPWLDGINSGDGFIRQFVAVPLGSGATVEGQVTGEETHGGVQLRAVGLTEEALAAWHAAREPAGPPVDRDEYVRAGLPWFDYYDADAKDLAPSKILAKVTSVGEKLGVEEDPFVPVDPKTVVTISGAGPTPVTDGSW
ncbi:hypothetical protein [Mycolicibacterium confluentis]|uniref:Uncharacterized protein n=1 Tax=Mycolicibacterium confluentis TaxID=28047 RepID=A0A7I7XXK8_9MYCO|nr:hypothetical protein [Mycolicibacterium confluentis]MCV7321866.1 hypothetical protein [Mycolicibacterium confluentis]ORV32121.1 hypothetical protein AWB99_10715 [Mycolicibacterium confluentis]BBZ33683.1 hypothetical protein MCNF_22880 [Mycolicibacterium confluentis]